MAESKNTDWRELCSAAANEQDAAKLTHLVSQIIKAFDQELLPRYSSDSSAAGAPD
jgi:hypothetical protein